MIETSSRKDCYGKVKPKNKNTFKNKFLAGLTTSFAEASKINLR